MKVRDLMHKGIEILAPDTPVTKLARKMSEKDIGAIAVGTDSRLVGMVTDRDITVRAGQPAMILLSSPLRTS